MDKDTQEKSAFATRSGLWKWKVLLVRLTSAPATFQRFIESVFHIIFIAPDFNTNTNRLEKFFKGRQNAGLNFKRSKCEPLQKEVKYLGHIMGPERVATNQEKGALFKIGLPQRE